MTVFQLYKIVTYLLDSGHSKDLVCIQKDTFPNPLESGDAILDVASAELMSFTVTDAEGSPKILCDGTVGCQTSCVLKGKMPSLIE